MFDLNFCVSKCIYNHAIYNYKLLLSSKKIKIDIMPCCKGFQGMPPYFLGLFIM